MARQTEYVSWNQFLGIMGGLLVIVVAVIGGGFAWLHSDVSNLTNGVAGVREGIAATNAKLDLLIQASRR